MERLGSLDAVFLAIEDSTSPMNIGSVGVFEGPAPAFEAIRDFVQARLDRVPRCRQRVVKPVHRYLRPVWIDDGDFDLGRHLHSTVLHPPDTIEHLVERVMTQPLPRDRPLWEMWVVTGLDDGAWGILAKVHHCMVDGIAGTDLLTALLDRTPEAEPPVPQAWTAEPTPSTPELIRFSVISWVRAARLRCGAAFRGLRHPRAAWRHARDCWSGAQGLWVQPGRRHSTLTGSIGSRRVWARCSISLADVAVIRRRLGGTVNDVVLGAIARGFRELLISRGEQVDRRTVMALVPVSTRTADQRGLADNRVAVVHALLPVGIPDPVACHTAVREHLDEVKASHQTDASGLLLHTGDFAPQPLADVIARWVVRVQQNIETIATNVPGPRFPLFVCGRRMTSAHPFAPIAGRIRIAVAVWSYCGTLFFGVTADGDSTDDLGVLAAGISSGWRALLASATSKPDPAS